MGYQLGLDSAILFGKRPFIQVQSIHTDRRLVDQLDRISAVCLGRTSSHHELTLRYRYVLNQGLIKISILLLYQNILSRSFSRISQYINWALMVFITFYTLAFYFLNVFQCNPVDAAWARLNLNDPYTKEWTCVDITYTIFLPSIISTVTDFIVAGFPIFFLRQLHLPERQKWLLVLVFGLVFM